MEARRRRFLVTAIASLAAVFSASIPLRAQQSPSGGSSGQNPAYHAILIPGIPEQGFNTLFPADINNHGVVVGSMSRLAGFVPVRAFLWDGVHPTVDLGDLGVFEFAQAVGINDAGQVIGYAEVLEGGSSTGHSFRGFLWQNGAMTALPPLGDDLDSQALSITENGEVLVVSYDRNDRGHDRYYIWSNGRIDQIGRLNAYPSGPSASAYSMNDSRQIVGAAIFDNGQQRAFLWQNGRVFDLGLAPGDDFFSA